MRFVTRPFAALQGKGLDKKVQFVKRQAFYSGRSGAVFVMDSEGDLARRLSKMVEGRNRELPRFPMAIGVAHPCMEAWLFTDPTAIRRGLGLEKTPNVTEEPEALPAPCQDGARNPKTILRDAASALKGELSSKEKTRLRRPQMTCPWFEIAALKVLPPSPKKSRAESALCSERGFAASTPSPRGRQTRRRGGRKNQT